MFDLLEDRRLLSLSSASDAPTLMALPLDSVATDEIIVRTTSNGQGETPPLTPANAPSVPQSSDPAYVDFVSVDTPSVGVVGRNIFYNQSKFDGNDAGANLADDSAIATDKVAYLPGAGLVGPSSITSYSRGINGIMVDLASNHGTLTQDDFTFKVGNSNTPSSWTSAPAPTQVLVRAAAGEGGSDRVEIIWANGAITNTWLEVIVEGNDAVGGFNSNTGLAVSDVFFFGNRVGDSGMSTPTSVFQTTINDANQVFSNLTGNAAIDNVRDYDRSGNVAVSDAGFAFANLGVIARINIASPEVFPTRDRPSSDLFHWGDAGYNAGFGPNLVKTGDGTLLFISEGRSGDFDGTSHAIIMRRSFDNGASWTPVSTIFGVPPQTIKVSSPAVVVDDQTGEVFLLFIMNSSEVFVTSSTNNGATWSNPREITRDVKVTEEGNPNPAAFPDTPWDWYAVGTGHGIQLKQGPYAGRMLIGADHRLTGNVDNISWSHVIYSDDHGQTWHLGGGLDPTNPINNYTNENTLVEGSDGSVYMSIRVNNQQFRGRSQSLDGGMTWSNLTLQGGLTNVVVHATLLRVNENTVLFAAPDSTEGARAGMTIWVSHDNMFSWVKTKTVFFGYASYSDMVLVGPDTVLLAFNGGRDDLEYRKHTFLLRFNLQWLESLDWYEFTWHFNEREPGQSTDLGGTSIYDSSPWDNRAIPLASSSAEAPQYVAGPDGHTALRLTSGSDRVTLTPAKTRALQFDANQSFTVELTMRTTDFSGIIIGTHPGVASWTLKLTGGYLQFMLDDLVHSSTVTSNQTINDGAWHRVVAVRDASTHQLTLTIDGVDIAGVPDATTLPLSSNMMMLGADPYSRNHLAFDIDVLRVTRRAIDSELWLPAVYAEPPRFPGPTFGAGAPNTIPGLQLWLPAYDYTRYFADMNFADPLPIEPPVGSSVHSAIDASPNQYRMTNSVQYSEDTAVGPHWLHGSNSPWTVHDSDGTHEHNFDFVQNTGKFTFSTFIKPGTFVDGYMTLFDTAEATLGMTGFSIKVNNDGSVSLTINGATSTVRFNQTSAPGLVSNGVWNHLAVVGNGPGNPVTIYVTPITSSTVSAYQLGSAITGPDGVYPTDADHDLAIGGLSKIGGRAFNGQMVDQAIYDRALTPTEIQQLFLGQESDILLIRAGGMVIAFSPATDTDAARGTALRAALSAATAGDEIRLGPGTFNLDAVTEPVRIPAGVTISGVNWLETILQSSLTQGQIGEEGCILEVASNVTLQNFQLWATDSGGNYQNPIGKLDELNPTATNVVLRNVWINAPNGSDCLYDWVTQGNSYFLYDCRLTSAYDTVAFLGSNPGSTLYAENTLFEAYGANWNGSPNGIANNLVSVISDFTLIGCSIITRNDVDTAFNTFGIATTHGDMVLVDTHFDVVANAGNVYDFISAGSATLSLSGCSGSGPNGEVTTSGGTVTVTGDPLASGTMTATTPQTNAGTTSATLGADSTPAMFAASGAANGDLSTTESTTFNSQVSMSRQVLAASPLTAGGAVSADRTITFSSQNANTILAGPTPGSAAAPSLRAMVQADLASHNVVGGVSLTGAPSLNKRNGTTGFVANNICTCPADKRALLVGFDDYNDTVWRGRLLAPLDGQRHDLPIES